MRPQSSSADFCATKGGRHACPARRNGRRRPGEPRMRGVTRGVKIATPSVRILLMLASVALRPWDVFRAGAAVSDALTWPGMCGNGPEAFGVTIPAQPSADTPTTRKTAARALCLIAASFVWCGEALGTSQPSKRAARFAAGTIRTPGTTSSVSVSASAHSATLGTDHLASGALDASAEGGRALDYETVRATRGREILDLAGTVRWSPDC